MISAEKKSLGRLTTSIEHIAEAAGATKSWRQAQRSSRLVPHKLGQTAHAASLCRDLRHSQVRRGSSVNKVAAYSRKVIKRSFYALNYLYTGFFKMFLATFLGNKYDKTKNTASIII